MRAESLHAREAPPLPEWIPSGSALPPSPFTSLSSLLSCLLALRLDGGGGRAFIRLCGQIAFALTRENGVRGTAGRLSPHFIMGRSDSTLSVHGMQTRQTSFALLLLAGIAREVLFVAALALRRSPSCKTRSAGYTTLAVIRPARKGKEERAREEKENREEGEKGKEIGLLFWDEPRRGIERTYKRWELRKKLYVDVDVDSYRNV